MLRCPVSSRNIPLVRGYSSKTSTVRRPSNLGQTKPRSVSNWRPVRIESRPPLIIDTRKLISNLTQEKHFSQPTIKKRNLSTETRKKIDETINAMINDFITAEKREKLFQTKAGKTIATGIKITFEIVLNICILILTIWAVVISIIFLLFIASLPILAIDSWLGKF